MTFLLGLGKFLIAFVAIASLLLWITNLIASITNPDLDLDENGKIKDNKLNRRVWLGFITSVFWALFFVL